MPSRSEGLSPGTSRSATQPEVSLRTQSAERSSLGLTVIAHPCLERIGDQVLLTELERPSGRVEITRGSPLLAPPRSNRRRSLEDSVLSRSRPVVLTAGGDGTVMLDASASRGSVLVNGEDVTEARLGATDLEKGVVLLLARRILLFLHVERAAAPLRSDPFGLVGESAAILRARNQIVEAADSPHPVLVRGPSGSGKELVAVAIHRLSRRGPLVAVNLATVPPSLAAAELFGAEKGAFDGLRERREGQFRQAHGGTLFLDELGDVPRDIQPMLLRVLEDRRVRPLGTEKISEVDVRFVAATDRDLEAAVAAGEFRPQLLYRLTSHEIHLPALVERREDLGRLLLYLLRTELGETGDDHRLSLDDPDSPWLPAEMVHELMFHEFRGNVRELRDVVRLLVRCARREGWQVDPGKMVAEVDEYLERCRAREQQATEAGSASARRLPAELREEELLEALLAAAGSATAAAEHLGISRTSFYKQWRRWGLPTTRTLSDAQILESFERCEGDVTRMALDLRVPKQGLFKRLKKMGLR